MHFLSPKLRSVVQAVSLVSVCLLTTSIAGAAPAPRTAKSVCDPQTVPVRRLLRHPRSFGGPLKMPTLLGLNELTSHVSRTHGNLGGENQAIQNDAPAARIDAEDQPVPTLRVVGLLVGSIDRDPRTLDFSPKSPRGPPTAA
jgi:hypothetical protein